MPQLQMAISDFHRLAEGIARPEDVVVAPTGEVYASDHDACVARILGDGSFRHLGPKGGAPNGLAMDREGRIIIANFGIYDGAPGPLERFDPRTGVHETLVAAVVGLALTSCNYPVVAEDGTIWCTHSTFAASWPEALDGRPDGFVFALLTDGTVRLAADMLRFANGCALDAGERFLYVCQTSAANVVRFPVLGPGELGPAEPYGPALGPLLQGPVDPDKLPPREIMQNLGYTDGCGFDAEGNLWVTLPAANKIVAITPAREVVTVVHDPEGLLFDHPTNIAWGGPDLRDLYVGSIRANYVLKARSPVAGMPLVHQR
ncbi:MAG: SMP-30/gluconolactonase/LRE family protein [Sphingomonadaceae bacterium]